MYAFETHAYEPMKRTKNPTFTMTYVTQPRLWNGHMYLAKFLLVGGATMLVFGVCVCVSVKVCFQDTRSADRASGMTTLSA